MRYRILLIAVSLMTMNAPSPASDGWQPDPALVEKLRKAKPERMVDESKVPQYELPDPLKFANGEPVRTREQWSSRRQEILNLFRAHVYGRSPGKPEELHFRIIHEDHQALAGTATLRRVAIQSRQGDRRHEFELILFLPNSRRDPVPVFLLINNRPPSNIDWSRKTKSEFWPVEEMIARGYGMATFYNAQLAPDDTRTFQDGVIRMFEGDATTRPADAWGAIGAWAWGAGRPRCGQGRRTNDSP
jgi:hypothetical protein